MGRLLFKGESLNSTQNVAQAIKYKDTNVESALDGLYDKEKTTSIVKLAEIDTTNKATALSLKAGQYKKYIIAFAGAWTENHIISDDDLQAIFKGFTYHIKGFIHYASATYYVSTIVRFNYSEFNMTEPHNAGWGACKVSLYGLK